MADQDPVEEILNCGTFSVFLWRDNPPYQVSYGKRMIVFEDIGHIKNINKITEALLGYLHERDYSGLG